ncbi:sugar nucleotide-binding protein [Flavobacteriaceae bacterium]|nr:sugar nucleotide-binding protein [Flavobacteriaceae bacterium]
MKVLILGADGMIGHKMAQSLSHFDLYLNSRSKSNYLQEYFPSSTLSNFDFLNQNIEDLLEKTLPDCIINAVGITIRRGASYNKETNFLNSQLPKKIDFWCKENQKKQIHFSTDCVFSGDKGNYNDLDLPDAKDNYGKSKGEGEINSNSTLTIRSSMIGREIYNKTELLEWVISNKNKKIKGFDNAIYSGVTTLWMSNTVNEIIKNNPDLFGIFNISSSPISKYDLITKINTYFNLNIEIERDSSYYSNKSLNSNRFFSETNFKKPNWDEMLNNLYLDSEKNKNLYSIR